MALDAKGGLHPHQFIDRILAGIQGIRSAAAGRSRQALWAAVPGGCSETMASYLIIEAMPMKPWHGQSCVADNQDEMEKYLIHAHQMATALTDAEEKEACF